MKKFAILGAVAALATAGGVFAAWTFSDGSSLNKSETVAIGGNIDTDVKYQGVGSFERTNSSTLNLTVTGVPGESANENTFTAALGGSVGYTYTAPTGNVNGTYSCTVTVTAAEKVIESGDNTITIPAVNKTYTLTSGSEQTISANDLWTSAPVCAGEINNYAEYTALKSAVEDISYSITVTAVETYTQA